ncbi:SusC/RagA family TonB-linked outer membrane protein [Pedobacter psychroterrae]|uniref:TonB-dependent receptor n=1 Tax=Pedobacter psychroterrae TaxID=2530453 RepID=A0A4R0NJV1_9SPHI|nr:TonB-dependent receptor [Pedobacter psychroterrae]TCD00499.1 TonB-dependent receptor [Pedobacter psychroterrae]
MKKIRLLLILLLSTCFIHQSLAQNYSVSGKATDKTGLPMVGVSVLVKGTNAGTTTNVQGNYTINVPQGTATLVFSYIGMISQEIVVTKSGVVDVVLDDNTDVLNEIVVVGYGSQRRSSVTGSISTVNTKELLQSPVGDLSNALAGRTPGVITKQPAGEPGSDAAQIYIRGNSTFGNATMEPLFVIDGIVRSFRDFSQMDPNEIESVNILKDASSAAIFGVKGANGVVLVTSKRGKSGKLSANYSFNYGFSEVTRLPKNLGSYEYGSLYNEAKINDNPDASPEFTLDRLEGFRSGSNPDLYPNTDWMDLVLGGNAPRLQHNVSLNGGTEKVKYFTSLGYLNEDGLYKSLNYNRYNVRSNLDIQATPTTRVSIDLSGRLEKRTTPPSGSIFEHTMRNPPIFPARFSDGRLASPGVYPNPLALVSEESGYNRTSGNYLLSNFQVVQDIPWVKGLSLKGVLAFDRSFTYNKTWNQWVPLYVRNDDGTFALTTPSKSALSKNFGEAKGTELQAHINYENRFGKHGISALALVIQKENENSGITGSRNAYESSALQILNFGPALNEVLQDNEDRTGLRSAAVRVNYDFDNKYLFQASLRRDESENFAPDRRVGYFPAFSAGWLISSEDFMKSVNAIEYLKVKASYGQLGSDRIASRFGYYNRYNLVANNYPFGTDLANGLTPGAIANPNVTWETSTKTDLGFETRLYKGMIGIDFSYFNEKRKDILTTRSLSVPLSFGASLPSENIGIVENKGFELVLSHTNRISDNWSYSLSGNVTVAKNKIIEAAEAVNVPPGKKITGRANNGYFGYKAIGIFRDLEDYNNSPKTTAFLNSTGPGDIKYEDISGADGVPDGKIDDFDITYLGGGALPEVLYGISGGVNFKGLEVNFLVQGATKVQQLLTQNSAWAFHNGGRVTEEWLDRWTPDNPDAALPRLSLNTNGNNYLTSSFWVENASYIRLKNVEIAYTLKSGFLSKISSSGVRFFATGQNLLTFTDILNVDPENSNAMGWYYPQQKTFTMGLNVQF